MANYDEILVAVEELQAVVTTTISSMVLHDNDNGLLRISTSRILFAQPVQAGDGSKWCMLWKEHYDEAFFGQVST